MLSYTRLDDVKQRRPLVHCISNIVSANDCANLALAIGASPIMAQAPEEMVEVTAQADATVLNTGTPDEEKFASCRLCGSLAQHPVVLDPVGVGASPWRLDRVRALLDMFTPAILRVNFGEARALLGVGGQEQGVDSPADAGLEERLETAAALARLRRCTVLLSGPEDVATDGERAYVQRGGSDLTRTVTGAGCMLSTLCGVFSAVESVPLQAAALASAFWKLCACRAEAIADGRGTASFRIALLDTAGNLTSEAFSRLAMVESC